MNGWKQTMGSELEAVTCHLCSKFSSKRLTAFERHLNEEHATTAQEQWNSLHGGPVLCACGCGKQTTWRGWRHGYQRMVSGHNGNLVAVYGVEGAAEVSKKRRRSLQGKPSWSKGLTKETDERVAKRAEATSLGRKTAFDDGTIEIWSKGLTKETDERVAAMAAAQKDRFAAGVLVPWAKGLTKETDERVANMAFKVSLSHQHHALRSELDRQKRLKLDEIRDRVEASGKLTLVSDNVDDYVNDNVATLRARCKKCGHEEVNTLRRLQQGRCYRCDPGGSAAQHEVKDWVASLGVHVDSNRRDVIGGLELDIFVPAHSFAIEYNGLYWHSLLHKGTSYHDDKSVRCMGAGIRLFHLFEDEWRDKRPIIESMVRHRLGLSSQKVMARRCKVVELTVEERRSFFTAHHVDGDTNARWALGLRLGDQLVAAMSLRTPFHRTHVGSLEVARFCSALGTTVSGGLSRLTEASRKKARGEGYSTLLSYVDTRWGERGGWETAGWTRTATTPPRFWWTDFERRFNRFKFRADKARNLTEAQVADEAQVVKLYGCKNIVFKLATAF